MNNQSIIPFLILTCTFFTACNSDDPTPENPEELITTLTMAFTPQGGGTVVTMQFRDLDGDGGNPPVITGGTLIAQTAYHAVITVLNESVNPTEDITEEILEEDEDHQFFFATTGLQMSHTYTDMDGDGNPIGVENTFLTGPAGTGSLTITLRHLPDKSASGVVNGDITNAGGETDIEVSLPVTIQ